LLALAVGAVAMSVLVMAAGRPDRAGPWPGTAGTPAPDDWVGRVRTAIRSRPWLVLPRLPDVVVPAVLVAWVFLAPITDDDGYYSAMAANVPFSGYVTNYYQLFNQGFTPFSWP